MFECEKKILLNKKEYERLIDLSGQAQSYSTQVNYYYDTEDLRMNSCGITCRIREKNGEYIATVKEHGVLDHHANVETSAIVNNALDDSAFRHLGVKYMGSLTTYRTILYKDGVFEIVIDKNDYLDKIDYELEIEYDPNKPEIADYAVYTIGRDLQIWDNTTNSEELFMRTIRSISKSRRFFDRFKEIHTSSERR